MCEKTIKYLFKEDIFMSLSNLAGWTFEKAYAYDKPTSCGGSDKPSSCGGSDK